MKNVVIVGVGEVVEQVKENLDTASSPLDLMLKASQRALDDSGVKGLKKALDTIAVIRTTSDSGAPLKSPFGDPANYPRSIAEAFGISPEHAIYSSVSGHTPQVLVSQFSGEIRRGEKDAVLIVCGEATANQKAMKKAKVKADWRNDISGPMDDRGADGYSLLDISQMYNELLNIPAMYSMLENARRARLGMSQADYAKECGALFEPFSKVAASHPNAMFKKKYSAAEIADLSETNNAITDIYTHAMTAKDGVNLAASVILMDEEKALALGIDPKKFIYPVTGSETCDNTMPYRADLSQSVAMTAAYDAAFKTADISVDDITCMDLYSCFPIAVFAACEALGITSNDPRGLTVTGGLPFFGGPGNSYSLHAIVNVAENLRKNGEGYGLVGANGGILTKHAIGIYGVSAPEKGFRQANKAALQTIVDTQSTPVFAEFADGRAMIETFAVEFGRAGPKRGFIFGRLEDGRRFLGSTDRADTETVQNLLAQDPIGKEVFVTSKGPGNRFTFDESKTLALTPALPSSLDGPFEHVLVHRNNAVLEITINRPDSRNSLTPEANFELEHIFNLFEQDRSLWVAIITGAGEKSFCSGNDLKYSASGKQMWVPETGFAGLTNRKKRFKPVIAAVNGYAFGGGLEIALACDVIVADETAKFALPEVKSGLIAAAGGLFRLPKRLPDSVAKEMILTGKAMDADEAKHFGLINYKTAAGQVMTKARKIAEQICAVSPTAVSASLEMMYSGADQVDPVDAMSGQSDAILKFAASEDLQIGLMAFLMKQTPKWKNK